MRRLLVSLAAAAAVAGAAGCSGTDVPAPLDNPGPPPPQPEPTPDLVEHEQPGVDAFDLELEVTEQQCFGSVGCNTTVEPLLTFTGEPGALETWTCDVRYTITGDDNGPVIGTLTTAGPDQYELRPHFLMTTAGNDPTVKVDSVSCI